MNYPELLADIVANYTRVGSPKENYRPGENQTDINNEGVKFYEVSTYLETADAGQRQIVYFYVRDEGLPTEQAFYRGVGLPYELTTGAYRIEIEGIIQNKITAGQILRGVVRECNEEFEFAVVRAWVLETGTVIEKRFFVYKDGGTNHFYPAEILVD